MIEPVSVVAMFPFVLHVLAGLGVVYEAGSPDAQRDSAEWWIDTFINCYRLGPRDGGSCQIIAYVQIAAAVVAMATHFLGAFNLRKMSYYVLLTIYAVTQLRHVLSGDGPVTIMFLFTHIAIFGTLVLYHDHLLASGEVRAKCTNKNT